MGDLTSNPPQTLTSFAKEDCKNNDIFYIFNCAHTDPFFKNLSILTIDNLVIHRIDIMVYKFSNCFLPTVLYSLYQKNNEVHTYNTGAKNMLHIFLFCKGKDLECTYGINRY